MNLTEIKAVIDRLEASVAAKGYYMPKVTIRINWVGYELTAELETRADAHASVKNEWFHDSYEAGFGVILARVEAYIDTLPSIEDAKRDAFIAAVGRLIDQGKEIGIEVEFLNPLADMMKKLSTNIITHKELPF